MLRAIPADGQTRIRVTMLRQRLQVSGQRFLRVPNRGFVGLSPRMTARQCWEVRKVPVVVVLNLKCVCQRLLFHRSSVYHSSSEKRRAQRECVRRSAPARS